MSTALIGIGSNLGDRGQSIRRALALLAESPGIEVVDSSRLYGSKPVGGPHNQGDYVNAAAVLQTTLSPRALLQVLHQIETQLGRTRSSRWAARTIDLDLLLFDDEIIEDDNLTLPHPRMSFRRFVLEPAVEIAAEMMHPVTMSRIDELLARIDNGPHYVAIGGMSIHEKSWLAGRLGYVMDCPQVLWGSQHEPWREDSSAVHLHISLIEPYKYWAGALSYKRWKAFPQLKPILDAPIVSAEDGSRTPPAVSNFWFEEWRLWACVCRKNEGCSPPAPPEYHELLRSLAELSKTIVSPKLVIWLNSSEYSAGEEQLWSSCLVEVLRQAPCGPLLCLDGDDRESMLAESIAAIKAMQPSEGDVL